MKIDLSGKSAVVTGSTGGIGFAIAAGLADCGAKIFLNGRQKDKVDAACKRLKGLLPRVDVDGVAADLASAEGCQALAEGVGAVDILVNNAGAYIVKDFFETDDADWLQMFQVNAMSGIRMSRALMPAMLRKNWGRIVFISSESALHVPQGTMPYGFSKMAQLSVSRGLAEHTAGTGVTVNSVMPGPTMSDGAAAFLRSMSGEGGPSFEETARAFMLERCPSSLLQRFASVEEVANMVVYLCSPQASATNGSAMRVEGGMIRTVI